MQMLAFTGKSVDLAERPGSCPQRWTRGDVEVFRHAADSAGTLQMSTEARCGFSLDA